MPLCDKSPTFGLDTHCCLGFFFFFLSCFPVCGRECVSLGKKSCRFSGNVPFYHFVEVSRIEEGRLVTLHVWRRFGESAGFPCDAEIRRESLGFEWRPGGGSPPRCRAAAGEAGIRPPADVWKHFPSPRHSVYCVLFSPVILPLVTRM